MSRTEAVVSKNWDEVAPVYGSFGSEPADLGTAGVGPVVGPKADIATRNTS